MAPSSVMPTAAPERDLVRLPRPRGPLSRRVVELLTGGSGDLDMEALTDRPLLPVLVDADFQLALWMLQATERAGFDGVDEAAVRSLDVIQLRWCLTHEFEASLRAAFVPPARGGLAGGGLTAFIDGLAAASSNQVRHQSAAETIERFLAKAPYLAWEADAHTLALAHLELDLKSAVADIQAGEYGVGHADTHAQIYRSCLAELGVDTSTAVDVAPTSGFALANTALLFGSDRSLRGAALGQLCLFEMDSVEPCRRQVEQWNRAGLPAGARRWYDVHVMADVEHDTVVRDRLIPTLESNHAELVRDAAFGAMVTDHILADLADRACAPAA